jgi:hypothetical protein
MERRVVPSPRPYSIKPVAKDNVRLMSCCGALRIVFAPQEAGNLPPAPNGGMDFDCSSAGKAAGRASLKLPTYATASPTVSAITAPLAPRGLFHAGGMLITIPTPPSPPPQRVASVRPAQKSRVGRQFLGIIRGRSVVGCFVRHQKDTLPEFHGQLRERVHAGNEPALSYQRRMRVESVKAKSGTTTSPL